MAATEASPQISIVIPTLNRYERLCTLLERLLEVSGEEAEILVIDQSNNASSAALSKVLRDQRVRAITMPAGNANAARNVGLANANGDVVLFLDDDVYPCTDELISRHRNWYENPQVVSVAGGVLGPNERRRKSRSIFTRIPRWGWLFFPMNYDRKVKLWAVGGSGNLSVRRVTALACGGFDEQFLAASHFEETEFLFRLLQHGGESWFDPAAGVIHFQDPSGGSRDKKLSGKAREDLVGTWYMLLRHAGPLSAALIALHMHLWRRFREASGEPTIGLRDYAAAFCEALRRVRQGPRLPFLEHPRELS